MSALIKAGRRKSKEKKDKKERKSNDKSASKKEKRTILREMSRSECSGSAFTGLLSEGGYDDEEAAKPIRFNNGGAKRYHYGSHQSNVRGSTSLGVGVSKFTSFAMHKVDLNDTWAKLSLHYSISIDDIRRFNKMYPTDTLTSRKELMIPINDENRHKVDPAVIMSSASAAAARATSPTESDDSGEADAGPNDSTSDPVPSKPSASDFLAQFDSSFGKTKSSVLKKSDDIRQPGSAKLYGSSGRGALTDNRIGNGIQGDTSHVSYQNRAR
mmetsp:Transcript_57144/g.79261  ORF Transcript_57144/g.79261 Transcript_57144/m.79261 type:complete len:270 (-) Transcript_57144:26-835(-)